MSIPNFAFVAFSSDGELSAQCHSKKSMDRAERLALNILNANCSKRRHCPVLWQGYRQK
ncbi:hypothetical protein CES86_1492 [Brucella lupini]|uniref:Uncharacterized protein n=1 Tax=Brucella lupini TaxID=255457 RepID=A0A256GV06_9HYPH|nr:hypothetical protein CES86_1492 [Brucella lupini]